jgi:hypothetical protein
LRQLRIYADLRRGDLQLDWNGRQLSVVRYFEQQPTLRRQSRGSYRQSRGAVPDLKRLLVSAAERDPTDGIAANNYQGHQRNYKANNQGDIKIEYDKSDKDKLTGFYSMSTAYDGTTPLLAISFSGPNLYPTKLGGMNWVHTFSPAF